MARIEISETVKRPRQEVFDYITDAEKAPEWMSFADAIETDGPPALGMKATTTASLMGVKFTSENEVTAYDEPELYEVSGDKPFPLTIRYEFTAIDDDTTRVDSTIDLDPGKFFPVGGRLLIRQIEKQTKKDVANLKKKLEA